MAYGKQTGSDQINRESLKEELYRIERPLVHLYGGEIDEEGNPIPWQEARRRFWIAYTLKYEGDWFYDPHCYGCWKKLPWHCSIRALSTRKSVDAHSCAGPAPRTERGRYFAALTFDALCSAYRGTVTQETKDIFAQALNSRPIEELTHVQPLLSTLTGVVRKFQEAL